jgi:hypothetical protein
METCRGTSLLTAHDIFVLFSNLDDLIALSAELLRELEAATSAALEEQLVGSCFVNLVRRKEGSSAHGGSAVPPRHADRRKSSTGPTRSSARTRTTP